MERDGAARFFDYGNRALVDLPDPGRELLNVRDRGGEREDADLGRGEKKRFLPDRAALGVIQIVDLVENDPADLLDAFRVLEKGIPVDLGGHNEERRSGIDRNVPGQDADNVFAETFLEVAEFLIAQGLDRGGVNDLFSACEGFFDRFFGDKCLARTCGRGDKQGMLFFNPLDGFDLERVQLE